MISGSQNTPILYANDGPLNGENWIINGDLSIGRDSECDISISDRQVSRVHAKIEIRDQDHLCLIDQNSKNGTYVNGDRLEEPYFLEDGDIIKIALIQELVYISSDATVPLSVKIPTLDNKTQKLYIDEKARRVWLGETEMVPPLSVSQYKLLRLLYHAKNEVVKREQIVSEVWGEEESIGVTEQALDALVRRLRRNLIKVDPSHEYIETIRGVGFLFKNDYFNS